MSKIIKMRSTSLQSAVGQDIELRKTSTTRFIFRPEIVDNIHDSRASVRGNFIFQKKKPSGNWEDYKTLSLSRLKNEEWVKLELKAGELFKLITELDRYYKIFKKYGIVLGKTDFVVTPQNAKYIVEQLLQNPENFEKLQDLKIEDLKKLNLISSINSLKAVIKIWKDNKENEDESFWQDLFKKNSWILAQIFSYPVILFKDQAYVGGKNIKNKGGNFVDFLFKNKLTDNVLLVEIKTPVTAIVGTPYRGEKIYSISNELSGSLVQVLNYQDKLQKNYHNLLSGDTEKFQSFNPKCMVISGTLSSPDLSENARKSFELYRSDSKQVEIIAFDELFGKVQMLIDLLDT